MPKRRNRQKATEAPIDVPQPVEAEGIAAADRDVDEAAGDSPAPAPARPVDVSAALAIRGWMSAAELTWLAERARESRQIVEIGCGIGRSTRALGDHVQVGPVFAVDPWSAEYFNNDNTVARWFRKLAPSADEMFAAFSANVGDLVQAGRVVPVRLTSIEAAAQYGWPPASMDLVFIDGDHRLEAVRSDIDAYRDLVAPGGILAGHDYGRADWPGVSKAVDAAFGSDVRVLDTIWWVRC